MINKTDWKYLAGILDTEGWIGMRKKHIKKGTILKTLRKGKLKEFMYKRDYTYYFCQISISVTEFSFLEHLKTIFNVGKIRKLKKEGNRKEQFQWIIENNKNIKLILKNTLHYLIIKQEQALIGLHSLKNKRKENREYYERMKKYNERGLIINKSYTVLPKLKRKYDEEILNEGDWRYLAGVIDTEGSIYCASKKIKQGGKIYDYQRIILSLHMTNKEFVKYIFNKYKKGKFKGYKREGYIYGDYHWIVLAERETKMILYKILPYLIIKKEQAILALETLKIDSKSREKYRLKMKELNKRGL